MNKLAVVLAVAIVVGAGASVSTSTPLANIVIENNSGGWFTTSNLDAAGDDLDQRITGANNSVVFSGHPAYVMESDEARLLYEMPRIYQYALIVRGSDVGKQFYQRLASDLRSGRAKWAIQSGMTRTILKQDPKMMDAFETHYCRVPLSETGGIYAESGGTLYRWVPNESACPPSRRPDSDWERPSP